MNRTKIMFILLVVIAFISTPFVAHTDYQISPNDNMGTITVSTSDAYNSLNPFNNDNSGIINITYSDPDGIEKLSC
jgi:hypothetical protein